MLQNSFNLMVKPKFSPVNCRLSVLCVCEYLSKPFIRITTIKDITTIEGIGTMFCLWSFLIIFTKQPTNSGLKIQK